MGIQIINTMQDLFPAANVAAQFVIDASPKDWSFASCLYMVSAEHVAANQTAVKIPEKITACTTGNADEQLAGYLQRFGLYRGPGACIIFDHRVIKADFGKLPDKEQFTCGLAVMIHEAAHVIDGRSWNDTHSHSTTNRSQVEHLKYTPHGARFVRAALHLWHRVNLCTGAFCHVPLEAITVAGEFYSMSPVASYELVLREELGAKLNQPISHVLMTEFPKYFSALWRDDLARTQGRSGAN